MKIFQINTVYKKGSTGKIAFQIQKECQKNGIENIVAYRYSEGENDKDSYCISTWFDCHAHNRIARYTHRAGFYSKIRTKRFVRYIKEYDPDIIHIHNIHGSYINIELLFDYIKKSGKKTIWTLHDCWAFTGNCPYFDIANCYKWQNGCRECDKYQFLHNRDISAKNWTAKKTLYSTLPNLTLVTPSEWLANLAKQSFLKDIPIRVINNGIDLNVFQPTESDFREKNHLIGKKIVLGVAFDWGIRKGLDVFVELSTMLPNDYQIVLVGTNDEIDKTLPPKILSIHKTNNQKELADIYSAADVFFIPTREENYPTVNMEAIACGTPVITFDTGGSGEIVDKNTGIVLTEKTAKAAYEAIVDICENHRFTTDDCVKRAKSFDMNKKFAEYIDLYKEIAKMQ